MPKRQREDARRLLIIMKNIKPTVKTGITKARNAKEGINTTQLPYQNK